SLSGARAWGTMRRGAGSREARAEGPSRPSQSAGQMYVRIGRGPMADEKAGTDQVLKERVQELLDTAINPAVAGHGGYIELIDVKDSTAYIRMAGGCQGCGAADVTLKAGIERMIFEEVPEISEVLDTTDHASGSNPYYAPSKG
ncbi:MAG: hypothetical protein DMD79_14790, partial [Candidatus Rokuibacteriota bacterium]